MKDIVIIANFCRDFSTNDNGRFMYLAKELSEKNRVEVITSSFFHATKKQREVMGYTWPFKITFIHEPGYKRNVSIRRFRSHHIWRKNVGEYLKSRAVPDVIYCAVPSLTAPNIAADYCEKTGTRFIIDIQDLWPEAFQMVINIPVVSNLAFAPIKLYENRIFKRADDICAVSNTYVSRALEVNKKDILGHAVFLGTKLETFDKNANCNFPLRKDDDEVWVVYCGSLSESYDLKTVIDAIDKVQKEIGEINHKLRLVVMGDGAKKAEFESYANAEKIRSSFTGKLPYNEMCAILKQCDIAVNPITSHSAASIINKHGDYAAAGLPVINTQEGFEYQHLVRQYGMGFNCKNGDSDEFARALLILINNRNLCEEMGKGARKCAEEKFDRKKSYIELINCIEQ